MRYAKLDTFELCNGQYVGVSLYVQGCHLHCPGCFNQSTWDFNGGKEWDEKAKKRLFELLDRPYIKRLTILGGEPLAPENMPTVREIIHNVRMWFPTKKIWLYTGYTWDFITSGASTIWTDSLLGYLDDIDVLVDGRFVEAQKDLALPFAGSRNQRVIDVQKTLKTGEVVLWNC